MLGDADSEAAVTDGGALRCTLPALPGAGFTALTLSDLTLADALLAGVVRTPAFPRSTGVQPPGGSADGGAVLSLVGAGFDGLAASPWCILSGTRAPAAFVSTALLMCEAPAVRPGLLLVQAGSAHSALAVAAGSGAAAFWALADPVPLSKTPSVGPLLGGTVVTVRGTGLTDADVVMCRIGTVGPMRTVPAGDGAVTCTTPSRGTGVAPLALSVNAQQFSPEINSAMFLYAQAPLAIGVSPSVGPIHGEGTLTVITSSLDTPAEALLCALGSAIAPPLSVLADTILCALLPGAAGFVRIAIFTTDDTSATSGAEFLLYEPPSLRLVLPVAASTLGGTLLHVSGAHFTPLETFCNAVLGAASLVTHVVSSALLQCETLPVRDEGPGFVSVLRTGTTTAELTEQLLYVLPPTLESVTPDAGPATGGAVVSLGGRGLRAGDLLACWMGTLGPLAARRGAGSSVECSAPAHAPGTLPVIVSWLGEFAPAGHHSAVLFTYWQPPHLPERGAAPWPEAVPSAGEVVVWLSLFDPPPGVQLLVLLGRASTSVTPEASGVLLLVPPHTPGFVSLELAYDAGTGDTPGAMAWALAGEVQIVTAPHLESLLPKLGTSGGGTLLHVTGMHFRGGAGETAMFFAGVRSPGGTFASSALWLAEVPPGGQGVTAAAVQLTSTASALAGLLPVLTTDGAEYLYTSLASVTSSTPPAGGDGGGMLVTLLGAMLRGGVDLRCLFGSVAVTASGLLSTNAVLCAAPARAPGTVCSLSAANNVVDAVFSGAAVFQHVPELALQHIAPEAGLTSGGSRVQLWGAGLLAQHLPGPASLLCRFGMIAAASHAVTAATAGESDALATTWCVAPPHAAGFVALEASLLGGNYTASSGVHFHYLPSPLAIVSWPAKAVAGGGTVISLRGRDLGVGGATLHVRFSSSTRDDAVLLSPSRLVSSAFITVEVPADAAGAPTPAVGRDALGVDAADFVYVPSPRLLAAAPALGSVRGGTSVSFAGTGFAAGEAHFCRFGSVGPIAAEFVSDVLLRCKTPAHAPGAPVPLGLSRANLVDFVSERGVVFEF
jgi:hypothetical protein